MFSTAVADQRRQESKQLFDAGQELYQNANERISYTVVNTSLPEVVGYYLGAIDHLLAIQEEDRIDEDYYLLSDYYDALQWPYKEMGNDKKSNEMHQLSMSYPNRIVSSNAYEKCSFAMGKLRDYYPQIGAVAKYLQAIVSELQDNLNKFRTDNDSRALMLCYQTLGNLAAFVADPSNADRFSVTNNSEASSLAMLSNYYYHRASQQIRFIKHPTESDQAMHHECANKANFPQVIISLPQRKHKLDEEVDAYAVTPPPQKKVKFNEERLSDGGSNTYFGNSNPIQANTPSSPDLGVYDLSDSMEIEWSERAVNKNQL